MACMIWNWFYIRSNCLKHNRNIVPTDHSIKRVVIRAYIPDFESEFIYVE